MKDSRRRRRSWLRKKSDICLRWGPKRRFYLIWKRRGRSVLIQKSMKRPRRCSRKGWKSTRRWLMNKTFFKLNFKEQQNQKRSSTKRCQQLTKNSLFRRILIFRLLEGKSTNKFFRGRIQNSRRKSWNLGKKWINFRKNYQLFRVRNITISEIWAFSKIKSNSIRKSWRNWGKSIWLWQR